MMPLLLIMLGVVIVGYAYGLRRDVATTSGGMVGEALGAPPMSTTMVGGRVEAPPRNMWLLRFDSFRRLRVPYIAACMLATMAVACVVLPFVLPWSPTEIDFDVLRATAPSVAHPLGTDAIGRDQLARLLAAGRVSLFIGLMVAVLSVLVGSLIGTLAGYFGGRTDIALMWFVDIMLAIPSLPLLIALSVLVSSKHSKVGAAIGALPEQWRIIIVMSVLGWMGISRVVRAQVLSLRSQEFVEAAHALGASSTRIMLRHIIPNCAATMVVFGTFAISGAIMGESFLSFLGVGVNPPTPTWGNMISESSGLFSVMQTWWLVWTPAVAIILTVLCTSFVGDGLRDTLDPQSSNDR